MARMGHASAGAGLVYCTTQKDRQRAIAATVGDLARQELRQLDASPLAIRRKDSGT
jgi:hypothetical protein